MMSLQQPDSQSIPKFKTRAELVTVPVVVLRHNQHVAGLNQQDFSIEEDGKPVKIASFEEVKESNGPMKQAVTPSGTYTNELAEQGPTTMIVIVMDMINTPFFYQNIAKRRLLEFLQNEYLTDRPIMLAVLHPDKLQILHEFTTDSHSLIDIAQKLKSHRQNDAGVDDPTDDTFGGELYKQVDIKAEYDAMDKMFYERNNPHDAFNRRLELGLHDQFYFELQQLAFALSSVRGMKTLVLVTGGFPIPIPLNTASSHSYDQYILTMKAMSAASISVYPIDVILQSDNPGFVSAARGAQGRQPDFSIRNVQHYMDVTNQTGGDYCLLRNEYKSCFSRAVAYNTEYYMLSYYPQPSKPAKWHKLKVKVQGEHLRVRSRSGYFTRGELHDPEGRLKMEVAEVFASPVEARGLPITVQWTKLETPKSTLANEATASLETTAHNEQQTMKHRFIVSIKAEDLTFDLDDNNHLQLDFVAAALDKDGKIIGDIAQQVDLHLTEPEMLRLKKNGISYANELNVPLQTAKVRFIVRDDLSERVGSVTTPPQFPKP